MIKIIGFLRSFLLVFWLILCALLCTLLVPFYWGKPILNLFFLKSLSWVGLKISGVRMTFTNREGVNSNQSVIYIGNHQSGFDLFSYGPLCPNNGVVIGKKELQWIPFLGWFLKGAGNILINRSKGKESREKLIEQAEQMKKRKVSIAIFPEGTRQKDISMTNPRLLPFKKGAFLMAVAAQAPIVPIVCSPIWDIAEWEKGKIYGGNLHIEVLPPIPTKGLTEKDVDALISKVHTMMENVFRKMARA